jgi:hypothetical protein
LQPGHWHGLRVHNTRYGLLRPQQWTFGRRFSENSNGMAD